MGNVNALIEVPNLFHPLPLVSPPSSWYIVNPMPQRPHSPYSDGGEMPTPDGYGNYGTTDWFAQNDGQIVSSLGLHLPTSGDPGRGEGVDD